MTRHVIQCFNQIQGYIWDAMVYLGLVDFICGVPRTCPQCYYHFSRTEDVGILAPASEGLQNSSTGCHGNVINEV
jgi:hypothetical protein